MSAFLNADKIKKPILLVHGLADNNTVRSFYFLFFEFEVEVTTFSSSSISLTASLSRKTNLKTTFNPNHRARSQYRASGCTRP